MICVGHKGQCWAQISRPTAHEWYKSCTQVHSRLQQPVLCTRPAVTFPAAGRHRCLTGISYTAWWTEAQSHHAGWRFHAALWRCYSFSAMPSVIWRCWLSGRKGIRPVKNWGCGDSMVICLEQGSDLHMAQLMPLPLTVSCFSKIQIGSTSLVPAHLGSSRKRAVKWVCVCHSRLPQCCCVPDCRPWTDTW